MADTLYERIEQHVREAEAKLTAGEALTLYHYLPNGEAITVTSIGYHNPYLMRFYGTDGQGNECDVLVHFASTHLVLRRTAASGPQKRRIGFTGDSV